MAHQKEAVDSGYWPLYRYDPRLEQPFQLDSRRAEDPAARLHRQGEPLHASCSVATRPKLPNSRPRQQHDVDERWHLYERLANTPPS